MLLACGKEMIIASKEPLYKLRVASWSPPITEQINLLAAEKNFFSAQGIAIDFIAGAGGGDAIENILSDKADIAFTDPGSLFSALERGEKLIALYDIYPHNVFNLVSLTDANIREPKDLKGKKIGVYSLSSGTRRNLLVLLRQARLTEEDVTIIETGVLNFNPLLQGQVDATAATDTGLASFLRTEQVSVEVMEAKDYFNYSSDVFVVTEAVYQQQYQQLQDFLVGYQTSVQWMAENVDAAALAAQKYTTDGADLAHNATIIELRNASSLPLSGELSELGLIDFDNLQSAADMYYELGLISRPLDLSSVVAPQYRLPLWSGKNAALPRR